VVEPGTGRRPAPLDSCEVQCPQPLERLAGAASSHRQD
jgi:hypothetical protein